MAEKYYVIATRIADGKVVVFPHKDSIDECETDIVEYDKIDNKTEKRFTYDILSPMKRKTK